MAGCGEKAADYTSVLTATTSAKPTQTTTPVPISQYLESAGVVGQPVAPDKLTDLTVTMPKPKGWEQYSNPRFAPGTRVIAKGDTYPTAMLMVFQLTGGDFDPKKAIEHGNADAQLSQNFKELNSSLDDFKGFPSSMIEGSYDLNGRRMHSYNRVVLATGAPPANQRYLIQFTVTGYAEKAQAEAPDIEAIIAGFDVSAPKPK
ncbi:LpqN/LpqT family lipoprotein [Mycolicibacterium sp. 120270]|uniref:LpqN/LpqT family lipoprotein n=1 Tax=Mycolicibacterium sp. 120270 TaxID=3090600 RepID=UPI00299EF839|nr:LpqN/LpqT family lipoprotein [Mycolicibacterium sp. 120270]MDX1885005.1 LpqN/LpqT family lipoprotein [Mycolicibacterium sp. 120270]